MKKQKGGILIKNKNIDESFNTFLENSDEIRLIRRTHSSVLFLSKLMNTKISESPYETFRPEDYKSPVKYILIKMSFVNTNDKVLNDKQTSLINGMIHEYIDYRNEQNDEMNIYRVIGSKDKFIDEINIQTDIFLKTIDYLDPICPAPVYGGIKNKEESIVFIENLQKINANEETKKQLNELSVMLKDVFNVLGENIPSLNKNYNFGLGVLAMEFADNYKEFVYLYNDVRYNRISVTNLRMYENMARLKLIELALKTGYSQCDFHYSNFMINLDVVGYYKNIPGRIMLIDLGYANKIPLESLEEIRKSYNNKDYMNCLQILYMLGRIRGENENRNTLIQYPNLYAWIPHLYDNVSKTEITNSEDDLDELNREIDFLINAQEEGINERIDLFDELHNQFPSEDIYPLLPLSNKIKNSLFTGILSGGKNRKTNRKNRKTNRKNRKNRKSKKAKK
jgi:hypothetical protein